MSAKARAGALRRDSAHLRSEARELLRPDVVMGDAARSILAVLAAREKRFVEMKGAYVRELGGRRRLAVALSDLQEWGTRVICRVRQVSGWGTRLLLRVLTTSHHYHSWRLLLMF